MKLRIKDNSLRFRLLRGEVDALAETGRVEAHTLLGATDKGDRLSYAVEHADRYQLIGVARIGNEIRVTAPTADILAWAKSDVVGVYFEQPVYGDEMLSVSLEKDFACLDRSDADNADTFDHPNAPRC